MSFVLCCSSSISCDLLSALKKSCCSVVLSQVAGISVNQREQQSWNPGRGFVGRGRRLYHTSITELPICCAAHVKYGERCLDTPSRESFPGFNLKSLSNVYQPKRAWLAPLQTLHASKHHTSRRVAFPPGMGGNGRQSHSIPGQAERSCGGNRSGRRWKGSNQLSKPIII